MERCFLCSKKANSSVLLTQIREAQAAASKKPLEKVLQHLANMIKLKLVFHKTASMCEECLNELCEYDDLMLNLLKRQQKLTNRLKLSVTGRTVELNIKEEDEEFQSIDAQLIEGNRAKSEEIEIDECIEDETLLEHMNDNEQNNNDNADDVYDDDSQNDDDDYYDGSENERKRSRTSHECMICELIFKSKIELQHHTTEVHTPKQFICQICGVVRRDEEYLELHMNIHEGKTENECRYCPKTFSRPVNTIRHMRFHWDKKKYQCEKCGERFSLDNMLYNHRMRHEAEENPIICSICHQVFKSRKTFNHHMTTHQENRPRHHCTLCSKSFTERYTLKVHMRTHSNAEIAAKKAETESVPDFKETEDSVKMILDAVTAEDDQRCVICNEAFESKELLERHLQFEHDVILK